MLDRRTSDGFRWTFAAVAGLVAGVVLLSIYGDVAPPLWVLATVFFAVGAGLGFLWPARPWRWGMAAVLGPVAGTALLALGSKGSVASVLWLVPLSGVLAGVPAVLGACIGALSATHREIANRRHDA